jgi:hypothetical protein
MSHTDVDKILSDFPGPVTVRGTRTRSFRALVTSLLFVCLGLWAVSTGFGFAWLFVWVFGLRAILSAVSLLWGPAKLTLDAEGLQINSVFNRSRLRWRDMADFRKSRFPLSFALSNNVFFRFLPLDRLSIAKLPLAKLFVGGDVELRNSFGLSADELARLLEHWRERAAAD